MSGPWNTAKSSLINWHPQAPWIRELLENEWKKVLVLGEVAREVAETINPSDDMSRFQEAISKKEEVRLAHLEKHIASWLYDVILVDRTFIDNFAYFVKNVLDKRITSQTSVVYPDIDLYDSVIYFDTPIKETSTEAFSHYNDDEINMLMKHFVKRRFWDKAKLFQNAITDREQVLVHIENLLWIKFTR